MSDWTIHESQLAPEEEIVVNCGKTREEFTRTAGVQRMLLTSMHVLVCTKSARRFSTAQVEKPSPCALSSRGDLTNREPRLDKMSPLVRPETK